MENTNEILNKKVGNIEPERKTLDSAIVKIESVLIQTTKHDGSKMTIPLVNILVKHPGREELIKIAKIKRLDKDKIITQSLWLNLDADENIQKDSGVDRIMKYLKIETLTEAEGKSIDTIEESEESSFLCLKLY